MSFAPIDDKTRHTDWLESELRRHRVPTFEEVSPTYIIRLANPDRLTALVADAIGEHGASIRYGYGIWNGIVEPDAEITIQCEPRVLTALLRAISEAYPDEEYLHVEKHNPLTAYVATEDYRR